MNICHVTNPSKIECYEQYYFRRITTMNKWFTDNGYDVKEIWDSIEVG